MRRTIHKFPLKREGFQLVNVPGYWSLLDIQLQGTELVLWCAVIEHTAAVQLEVTIVGTGQSIPESVAIDSHRRTIQDVHDLAWHVFVHEVKAR